MNLKLFRLLIRYLEPFFSNYYVSLVSRVKHSDQIGAMPDINIFDKTVAIVMQGPIIDKDQFTFETLKIYRKRFPEVMLILSTWDDYSSEILQKYRELGVKVIENKKPAYYGISNINLQIESTKNGVKEAYKSGAEYCLKTRTDQRIYRHDFILFFLSLIKTFPLNKKYERIKGRLISVSLNTYKYRLYGVTDMLTFGYIEDMLLYWDVDYDLRKMEEIDAGTTVEDWGKARICEVYLSTEYLKKIGYNPQFTLKDSWKVISEYFCIVDRFSIDLFWLKYNRWNEQRTYTNQNRSLEEEFTFSDWINAKNNCALYKSDSENLLMKMNMSQFYI